MLIMNPKINDCNVKYTSIPCYDKDKYVLRNLF